MELENCMWSERKWCTKVYFDVSVLSSVFELLLWKSKKLQKKKKSEFSFWMWWHWYTDMSICQLYLRMWFPQVCWCRPLILGPSLDYITSSSPDKNTQWNVSQEKKRKRKKEWKKSETEYAWISILFKLLKQEKISNWVEFKNSKKSCEGYSELRCRKRKKTEI